MKMWSGRIAGRIDPEFELWQRSFPYDQRLLPYEIAASKAHAEALHDCGILSAAELEQVLRGLDSLLETGISADVDPAIEDVHDFVERRLVEIAGAVGYKLHTGRSRNEQIATDLRLFVRDEASELCKLLAEFIAAILQQAEAAGDAAMPAYTHTQRAEPVLVAHWLLAYCEMFFRDIDRLAGCAARANECPLGSAAVAGTFLAINRARIAKKLGFDRPTANSIDATSDRDFVIDFAQVLALLASHLSRWAGELILFSTHEYGFVSLPDQFCTGSSAMPQKKNADALELVRGKAGRIAGHAVALLMNAKGLPLAYNKDLQQTQEPLFDSADQCSAMLTIATGVMSALTFNFEKMQQAAQTGCMNATAAAAYLVHRGIPFRHAHQLIGNAVRLAIQKQCELEDLSLDDLKLCGIECDQDFYAHLSLSAVMASHNVEGGTAPSRVREALAAARIRLASLKGADHVCA